MPTRRRRRPARAWATALAWSSPSSAGTARGSSVSGSMAGPSLAGDLDLFAERLPDLAVDLEELRGEPDLLRLARPFQRHVERGLDRGGTGGHHDHAVAEHD